MPGNFDVENYVSVNARIKLFWEQNPKGRIVTSIKHLDSELVSVGRMVVIEAQIFRTSDSTELVAATGLAKEREGTGGANKTSFLENAETSAIGRALGNMGYLIDKSRASREEMESVQRREEEHVAALTQLQKLGKNDPEIKARLKKVWEQAQSDPIFAIKLVEELLNAK